MKRLVAASIIVLLMSCAPRFTVYLDLTGTMATSDITVLSIDTLDDMSDSQKKVKYVLKRDLGWVEAVIYRRRQRKIKSEVDKLTR